MLRRIVRTNITENTDPHTWTEILPQHEKDILTGSTHLKVTAHHSCFQHAFSSSTYGLAALNRTCYRLRSPPLVLLTSRQTHGPLHGRGLYVATMVGPAYHTAAIIMQTLHGRPGRTCTGGMPRSPGASHAHP